MLQEHEKFYAFISLLLSVVGLAVLVVLNPVPDGSGSQRILDAAMGGLLLALGGCANALFRISNSTEQQAIGEATAKAMSERGPLPVEVQNLPGNAVPVEETYPKPPESQSEGITGGATAPKP